jgi:hypothetical protein
VEGDRSLVLNKRRSPFVDSSKRAIAFIVGES